jgi:hypothetical protein
MQSNCRFKPAVGSIRFLYKVADEVRLANYRAIVRRSAAKDRTGNYQPSPCGW